MSEEILDAVSSRLQNTIMKNSLKTIRQHLSSGFSNGWTRSPWAIVIHYTATFSAAQTLDVFKSRNLSVHSCIERDGTNYRFLPNNKRAWHAGTSSWGGQSSLNNHAFGIEMVNFGWADGEYYGSEGKPIVKAKQSQKEVAPSDSQFYRDETYNSKTIRVVTSQHCEKANDHRRNMRDKIWASYTDEQVYAAAHQAAEWAKSFSILPENMVGHEHVSPGRKQDPGPMFPWRRFDEELVRMLEKTNPELLNPNFKRQDRVKAVQSHLVRMGLPVGDIDGLWGDKTQVAIEVAVDRFGTFYGFEDLKIDKDNTIEICSAFKLVPGFDPGRQ